METYVQETAALLYLKKIADTSRQKVIAVAKLFRQVLARSFMLKAAKVPKEVWYKLHSKADLWR